MFDSGFGGLTVARAVIDLLPAEDLVYIGDTGRYPYGPRPQAEVTVFARELAWSLVKDFDAKAVVVACNTAAAAGLDELAAELPVPVFEVIEPGARALVQATRSGRVGVIGTVGTVSSGAYARAVEATGADVELTAAACPGFVEFVERGETDGEQVTILAERLLAPVRAADVDTLLLGCTHYPYLARVIGDVMGPEVVLVSSADETAFALRGELERRQLLRTPDRRSAGRPPLPVLGATSPGSPTWAGGCSVPSWRTPAAGRPSTRRPISRRPTAAVHSPTRRPPARPKEHHDPSRRTQRRTSCARSASSGTSPPMAGGSVLVAFGATRVLCTASVDDDVPRWMKGKGRGWVTAEYSMLPGSSPERVDREAVRGKQGGRTMEIQRLIGRALRASCDLVLLGERQVVVDCDVLQADGGTRTASICAGYLALHDALARLVQDGQLARAPAALAVRGHQRRDRGLGVPVLDLPYVEDSPGRGRHERRHAGEAERRRRPLRRGAGHGRGRGVHPRRARRPARPRRGRPGRAVRAPGRVRLGAARTAPVSGTRRTTGRRA